jgi:hypothetical protein
MRSAFGRTRRRSIEVSCLADNDQIGPVCDSRLATACASAGATTLTAAT